MPAGDNRPRPSSVDALVLVQLGSEFACALTRGWLLALAERTPGFCVVTRPQHRELLDLGRDASHCHVLRSGVLALLTEARRLRQDGAAMTGLLDSTHASRLLASLARTPTVAASPPVAEMDAVTAADTALQGVFGHFGVISPVRPTPLTVTRATQGDAMRLLERLGLRAREHTLCAPAPSPSTPAWLAELAAGDSMPLILLPRGHELLLMRELAGCAFFERADDLALRAALLARARRVVSDDPATLELARLVGSETCDVRPAPASAPRRPPAGS